MKLAELDYQKAFVIEQLEKYGYTYKELVNKLAAARAMEVDAENSDNKWF